MNIRVVYHYMGRVHVYSVSMVRQLGLPFIVACFTHAPKDERGMSNGILLRSHMPKRARFPSKLIHFASSTHLLVPADRHPIGVQFVRSTECNQTLP